MKRKELKQLIEEVIKESIESPFEKWSNESKLKWWNSLQDNSDIKQEYNKDFVKDPVRAKLIANIKYYRYLLNNHLGDYNCKKWLKQAVNELDKYDRNQEKKKYNIDDIKKIIKSHGLTVTTYASTAIRGYSRPSSNSYEISKYEPRFINFSGIALDKFNAIKQDIINAGFKIESYSEPQKVIGQNNTSSITIGK